MPESGTIRASMGLNNKPLVEALKESKRHVENFARGVNKTSFEGMTKAFGAATGGGGPTPPGGGGGGILAGLRAAGVGALAFKGLKDILSLAAEAGRKSRDEVLGLERATHKLVRTSDFSSSAEGVEELTGKYRGLERQVRKLNDAESGFSVPRHPFLGSLRHLGEQLRGREGLATGASESEVRIARQKKEIAERLLSIGQKLSQASKLEYETTRATVEEDDIQGAIKHEQLQTEARIEKLRKAQVAPEVIAPIERASELRIKALRAEESFRKLDIAAAFQAAQVTRPGIGLTAPEVQGAQLLRQRADIQQRIRIEPSAIGRARLGVEAAQNRNQIEEAEFQQWWRRGAKSGAGTSQGGRFTTAAEGLKAFAKYRQRIQDMIRSNPELQKTLDVEIGAPFAFGAPRQTQLMPATITPAASSPAERSDISGGRSLNDIYQLIDKKWQ